MPPSRDIGALLRQLEDTPTEDLIDTAKETKDTIAGLVWENGIREAEILRRMEAERAKLGIGNVYTATATRGAQYSWDIPSLRDALLRRGLRPEDYIIDKVVPQHVESKVQTVSLLAVARGLGEKGRVIMECATIEEGDPKLSYKERK